MPFSFKPFGEMTADDYAAIGFMSGLEVHQQLLTKRKLFCRCPARPYSDEFDAEVLRHMRPTLSELGEYDGTALMEKKTRKNIYYRIHHDTVCTYEFDDTPPFFPDEDALDISLGICMLFHLNLVSEMHIARKQYLDGSIPTGFQRTAILGVDGQIPFKGRRIGVRQLSLEEDACREVSDVGHDRVYLTDRLGLPLIETVTEPDMRTPQETAEVCQIIRMVCRSTGKVRTGYGTTREDVNVSVRGGTRVEIKGVPQIKRIPLLVYNEAMRQCALLNIRGLLKERGITPETLSWTSHDVTRAVAKTQYEPIRNAITQGLLVKCVVLKGFAGILNHPTQEHTTFAKEFSDRVRVIACLTNLPNIVHSDTATDLLTVRDWKELRRRTQAAEQDALVLVWGNEQDTQCACNEIVLRAREATQGVPSDTRQALKDGTTGFERVLPGAERMYPDTDLPPMVIAEERLAAIRAKLPMPFWDREAMYRKMGLPADAIIPLCRSARVGLFDKLVNEVGVNPVFAAVVLVQRFKEFRRAGLHPESFTDDEILGVFKSHAEGQLAREGVAEVFERALRDHAETAAGPSRVAAACRGLVGPGPAKPGEVDLRVAEAVEGVEKMPFASVEKKYRYLMGQLMKTFLGRAEGGRVSESLKRRLEAIAGGTARREVKA